MSPRGKKWSPQHLSKEIKRYAREAKVREELRPYDLRGTACTKLLLAGGTLGEIALFMGWTYETAAKMIKIYAALDPDLSDSILDRLTAQVAEA